MLKLFADDRLEVLDHGGLLLVPGEAERERLLPWQLRGVPVSVSPGVAVNPSRLPPHTELPADGKLEDPVNFPVSCLDQPGADPVVGHLEEAVVEARRPDQLGGSGGGSTVTA